MKVYDLRLMQPNTICALRMPGQKLKLVIMWYRCPSGVVFRMPDTSTIEIPFRHAHYVENLEQESGADTAKVVGTTTRANSARG